MTRAGLYGLAMLAAVLAAVFAWKAIVATGVAAAAWRIVVRRARTETTDSKRIRFGLVLSIAMLAAAWNTRPARTRSVRCRVGLHRWETETTKRGKWGKRTPDLLISQRCQREGCPYHEWMDVGSEPAPVQQCFAGHTFRAWSQYDCPVCLSAARRERRKRSR